MKAFTFAVITDSHIRLEEGYHHTIYPSGHLANARSRYAVKKINQLGPDLVIHLGDVTHPLPALPECEAAVQVARDLYKRLNIEFFVVPGNHDVGDKPNSWVPAPAVDEESHEIFEEHWGRSFLSFDHKGCHFVLINSPVLNSGLQREKDQREWLEQDLAANHKAGKRFFFFTHYPIYLNHPREEEHYDNIAEPARSWLLSLLEDYDVEAVFAGHSHNFFYNRHLETNLYVLPSVAYVRADLSELFHCGPASEYGRNDAEKLGFFLVRVDQQGHYIESIRTRGLTDEREEAIAIRPLSLAGKTIETNAAPVGFFLRHSWAQSIEMPYGNLDEFTRKVIRNDYALQALWALGVRKLRVPIGDLADNHTRGRIRALRSMGHEFTVFSVGAPTLRAKETIARYHDLITAWEVTAPWDQMPEAISGVRDVKQTSAVRTCLSKLDNLADQYRDKEFRLSHMPSHGFRLEEPDLLSICVTKYGAAEAVDGFVFRLTNDTPPYEGIRSAGQRVADLNLGAVVHVQLPREGQGLIYAEEPEISNRVAETLATAFATKGVEVFLDTFVDHDRGYFPRNGLLDRRYNPRSSYYVFRHLYRALSGGQHELQMIPIDGSAGVRAFALENRQYSCVLLLSVAEANRVELDLSGLAGSDARGGSWKWMDLRTGKVKEVHCRHSLSDGDEITLDSPSKRFDPALLILRGEFV